MRILFNAYPLLPVSDESCGGAEQMLWTLERELHGRGHETFVASCEDSRVSGTLIPTGSAASSNDQLAQREAEHDACVLAAIEYACASGKPFDLVHDEGGLFWRHAHRISEPVLATLHLPLGFYGAAAFANVPRNVTFNFVSQSQRKSFAAHVPHMGQVAVVPNGVALERFEFCEQKSNYLLWLGRICEEKGTHVAIEVARLAEMPLVIAGQVYPFEYHRRYFAETVAPQFGGDIRFVESPSFYEKVTLLGDARALLVPSAIDETSSLVGMEAAACGTPVIAFARGAIPEVVCHGETGFVVDNADEMVGALQRDGKISPRACRVRAERKFSAARMADDYERLYRSIIRNEWTAAIA